MIRLEIHWQNPMTGLVTCLFTTAYNRQPTCWFFYARYSAHLYYGELGEAAFTSWPFRCSGMTNLAQFTTSVWSRCW